MENPNAEPGASEEAAVALLLTLASPPGSDRPQVSWTRKLEGDPDLLRDALNTVPGIRYDGDRIWRLGDPGDPWTLTLVVLGQTLVATAPQGWTGGTNPGEGQAFFGDWMESWMARLTFPSTP